MADAGDVQLLALMGLTPAVITETLWHLAVKERRRVVRLSVLTTALGQARAAALDAALTELRAAHPKACGALPAPEWHVLDGVPDILSSGDAARASDLVLEVVRALTERDRPPLVLSAAGGRKTMSLAAAAAFQLLARVGDRLVHVLVREDDPGEAPKGRPEIGAFEFLFPRPGHVVTPKPPAARPGPPLGSLDHGRVTVEVADVPMVPLRRLLEGTRALEKVGFETTWALARLRLMATQPMPTLRVDLPARCIELVDDSDRVLFEHRVRRWNRFLLYAVFAERRARSDCGRACLGCRGCGLTDADWGRDETHTVAAWGERLTSTTSGLVKSLSDVRERGRILNKHLSEAQTELEDTARGTAASELSWTLAVRYEDPRDRAPQDVLRALCYPGPVEFVAPRSRSSRRP